MKNPATKRARALRAAPRAAHARDDRARRSRTGSTSCGRSWTSSTPACSARASDSSAHSPGRSRRTATTRALERLRAMVQPFILRRPKDGPEVELELPPITVTKEYCRLTLEQASLYRATVDRWMPRIEEHERSFGRRGAVLAMLEPAEAGLQPPGDGARRPAARSTGARASSSASSSCSRRCRATTRRSSSRSTPASTGSCRTCVERLGREVGFFHGGLPARQRDELVASFSHRPTGRRCS